MNVSFVGAHGTGKSTLSSLVHAALAGLSCNTWRYIPEVAREVLDYHGVTENLGNYSVEKIISVQQDILDRKLQERNGCNFCIEDRHPLIDVYAYSIYWLARHPSAATFLNEIRERVELGAIDDFKNDLIVLVPPTIPLILDGVRAEAYHFRDTIDYIIRGILDRHLYASHTLISEPLDGRLEESLRLISGKA